MGQKLSTLPPSYPLVNVRGKKGQFFVGRLLDKRSIESKWVTKDGTKKVQEIYEFAVEDTDMETLKKVGPELFEPVDIREGDRVSIFAPSRLANGVRQAAIGQTLRIEYLGQGRTAQGGKPHDYSVEVVG